MNKTRRGRRSEHVQGNEVRTFERRRLRVYVAGPISSDPMTGIHRATAMSRQMFLDGMAPFVPHWDAYWWLGEGYWNAYLEYDLEFVAVCDAVYRLTGASKGACLECEVAESLGIPVFSEDECVPNTAREADIHTAYQRLLAYQRAERLTGVRT
jgi:hypothetical protein